MKSSLLSLSRTTCAILQNCPAGTAIGRHQFNDHVSSLGSKFEATPIDNLKEILSATKGSVYLQQPVGRVQCEVA